MPTDTHETSLLRCFTAGSVDDGKSTLIGRLLFDTRQVLADQLAQVEAASKRRGFARTDLALLTDGLRAEREQGITIDVAWRYFATAKRKFVLADTPGHVQYTRNMVTGASTAEVALVLVDARQGLVQQSRRHVFLSRLLGLEQLVVCVNKMDLVGYDRARFEQVQSDMRAFVERLGGRAALHFVPMAALHGDNIVDRSANMDWYEGPTLLELLESLPATAALTERGVRFPVQWVLRPQNDAHHDYRGYAGQLAAGVLKPGDAVTVLPAGHAATVARIETLDGPLDEAWPPMAVTVHLKEDIDISRGDLLATGAQPTVGRELRATLCWMSTKAPGPRPSYLLKHTTRTVKALLERVEFRYDVDTLERQSEGVSLGLNDIAVVRLRTSAPLAWDAYSVNRATGSFVLIDEATNETVAGGMLLADDEAPVGG